MVKFPDVTVTVNRFFFDKLHYSLPPAWYVRDWATLNMCFNHNIMLSKKHVLYEWLCYQPKIINLLFWQYLFCLCYSLTVVVILTSPSLKAFSHFCLKQLWKIEHSLQRTNPWITMVSILHYSNAFHFSSKCFFSV